MNKDTARMDHTLYIATVALVLGGLIMIYSGSSALALREFHDGAYFFKRQLMWLVIALICGVAFFRMDMEKIKKYSAPLLLAFIVLIFAVHVPGLGHRAHGGIRWSKIGPFMFQPFEAAKLFYVIYLSFLLSREKTDMNIRLLKACGVTIVLAAGLIWQKDLGGTVIIMALFLAMALIGGVDLKYLVILVLLVLGVIAFFIITEPYRIIRVLSYLNPWKDPLGSGWQTIQSLTAIGSGGPLGVGIFESQQKFYYLPTPHTDYIFSIIGEELGTWGSALVIVGFFFVMQRGFYTALHADDPESKFLAAGLTLMIIIQALVNIYVSLGMLPPKGTTLPFLSFGGSSLMANVIAVAILLSISRRVHGARA